jgi:hypothetical protein
VKLGRWASLVFNTWQELCFTSGMHPFTGEGMNSELPTKLDSKEPAGAKARAGAAAAAAAAAPGARAELQRCFMRACGSVQDQLARESAGLMLVAVLLAVAACTLIGSLSNRGDWGGGGGRLVMGKGQWGISAKGRRSKSVRGALVPENTR